MGHKNQSGFSAIISIVSIVLVIGVLGFIGWRLYGQPGAKTNDSTSNNQTTSKTPANNTTTPPAQQVDPNAGYFVIKEWGVRFKPTSGLVGLEYALRFNDSTAIFSTPAITAVDAHCGIQSEEYSGIDSIGRYKVGAEQPVTGAWYLTTINGYNYYFGGSGGADCVYDLNNTAGQNLLHAQETDFSNSIKSLEAERPTYLDIKELGVKIQLSDVIKDAVYSINGSTATLSTTSITQQSNGACSLANGGMAAVTEYNSDTDPVRGTKILPNGTTILKIGNNYFVMTLPGAPCWNGSNLGAQQRTAFVDAFKTAQLDQ